MERGQKREVMVLNRKSGRAVGEPQGETRRSIEESKYDNINDKIPIVIKNMQFTLRKY